MRSWLQKMVQSRGEKGVSITECGFFISKTHDLLSASPDGIIIAEEESTPGVVELKFIQVKPGETLAHALLRQRIIQVKKKHTHTQVLFSDVSANVCHRISLGSSHCPGN